MRYLSAGLLAFATTVANAASELDTPSVKAGLWESRMFSEGKEEVSRRCIEEPNNKLTIWFGKAMGEAGAEREVCWRLNAQRVGDAYMVESFCKYGNTLFTMISGDFEQANTVEMRSIVDLPGKGQVDVITTKVRWIGACTPERKSDSAPEAPKR